MHVGVRVESRQDDDLGRRSVCLELAGGGESVEHGHPDVEQEHIRRVLGNEPNGFGSIDRLGENVEVGLGRQDQAQAGANQLFVVRDDHTDAHA